MKRKTKHKCPECGKGYKTQGRFNIHMATVHGQPPDTTPQQPGSSIVSLKDLLACPDCDFIGKGPQSLAMHRRWNHDPKARKRLMQGHSPKAKSHTRKVKRNAVTHVSTNPVLPFSPPGFPAIPQPSHVPSATFKHCPHCAADLEATAFNFLSAMYGIQPQTSG